VVEEATAYGCISLDNRLGRQQVLEDVVADEKQLLVGEDLRP